MQKERPAKPFFLACLYAALTALAIGICLLLIFCALCFFADDPASVAGYCANIALLLTAFVAGLLAQGSLRTPSDSALTSLLRGLTTGAIVFCLLLGLSLLVPNGNAHRLTHILTTLPIYALCVLGMSAIGALATVTRRPKKRATRAPKHVHARRGARRLR